MVGGNSNSGTGSMGSGKKVLSGRRGGEGRGETPIACSRKRVNWKEGIGLLINRYYIHVYDLYCKGIVVQFAAVHGISRRKNM